jgi:6-phosphogluconolactonase
MKNCHLIFLIPLILSGCRTEEEKEDKQVDSADMSATAGNESFKFYMGTYTGGESEGIYQYMLLPNGQMEKTGLLSRTENPSFLAMSSDKKYLLAVNETKEGSIESYAIEVDSLTLISERPSGGASPCYISVNEQGYVLTANYNGGNVGLFRLNAQGELSLPLDVQQHTGQGATSRQDKPHAHFAKFVPNTQDVISVDLGTNELWFSQLDTTGQKLIPHQPQTLAMDAGAGPRHLAIHPKSGRIYVMNELNHTVSVLERDGTSYRIKTSYPSLPDASCEECSGADIHISSDGRFLYTSIRGHNSISVFQIEEAGELVFVENIGTRGESPRNFAISPDERFLVVANQHTNNLVSYRRDKTTGKLEFRASVAAPSPVAILF